MTISRSTTMVRPPARGRNFFWRFSVDTKVVCFQPRKLQHIRCRGIAIFVVMPSSVINPGVVAQPYIILSPQQEILLFTPSYGTVSAVMVLFLVSCGFWFSVCIDEPPAISLSFSTMSHIFLDIFCNRAGVVCTVPPCTRTSEAINVPQKPLRKNRQQFSFLLSQISLFSIYINQQSELYHINSSHICANAKNIRIAVRIFGRTLFKIS